VTPASVTSPALAAAIERTAERFRRAGAARSQRYYVRGKLRTDPSTAAVANLRPLGRVIDLGCGRGQLAVLLLEAGAASHVDGFDWDRRKIDLARRAAAGLPAAFHEGDVRRVSAEPADSVLLVDVLHYFDDDTQDVLLMRAADLVLPGGRLIVRDADSRRGWRSAATRIQERLATSARFNRGERVRFRDMERELVRPLEARNMRCTLSACWSGTPFSNMLLVAQR